MANSDTRPPCFGVNPSPLDQLCGGCGVRHKCFVTYNETSPIKLRLWRMQARSDAIKVEARPILTPDVPSISVYWSELYNRLKDLGLDRERWRVNKRGVRARNGAQNWEVWRLSRATRKYNVFAVERADTRELRIRVFTTSFRVRSEYTELEKVEGAPHYRGTFDPDNVDRVVSLVKALLDDVYFNS